MKRMFGLLILIIFILTLSGLTGCVKGKYFAVPNEAIGTPKEFAETETAIQKAEKSPGAKYAPEKIAKAKDLAQEGVQTYWACRTKEAMAKLEQARKLAGEAMLAKAPPPPPAPKVVIKPPPPPPKVVKVVTPPPKPKKIIVLRGTNFEFDSAKLTPEAQVILDNQAAVLKEESIKVRILGHTDSIGTEEYNLDLSERRARSVEEYLRSKGVDDSRMEIEGCGFSQPVAPNDTKEGRAKNRRVEFQILK